MPTVKLTTAVSIHIMPSNLLLWINGRFL